MHMQEISYLYR